MEASTPHLRITPLSETIRERTVETLRDAICGLHFKPGQRLIERELCEQTGVSRTTIREALRHLETEGLVEIVPRKGPVVASLSATDARDIYQVRGALERLAGQLFAARASTTDMRKLSAALKRLQAATHAHDLKSALAANEEFYDVIFAHSGNDLAHSMHQMLRARITLLRAQVTAQWNRKNNKESLARMAKIVQALRQGDSSAAGVLMEAHATKSAEAILRVLESLDSQEVVS